VKKITLEICYFVYVVNTRFDYCCNRSIDDIVVMAVT